MNYDPSGIASSLLFEGGTPLGGYLGASYMN
jgi:hypothetical protein